MNVSVSSTLRLHFGKGPFPSGLRTREVYSFEGYVASCGLILFVSCAIETIILVLSMSKSCLVAVSVSNLNVIGFLQ